MDEATMAALGREIFEAERVGRAGEPLSARYQLDPRSAYAIQEQYAGLRLQQAQLVGRKIGCTSTAIQDLFGIDTPDYGQLFDDMAVPDGGEIALAALIQPMVEAEIAFVPHDDLRGPGLTVGDVLAATAAVAPALEIIDSRILDWRIEFVDTVADNGSSARYVVGPWTPYDVAMDLAAETVVLRRDDEMVDSATGAAVLGHPAAAVAWLANALADYDRGLRAGDLVLSGSMTRAARAAPAETYTADFGTLGSVSCRFR
jgi:2-keto-4-pentenoate hydratase